MVSQVKTTSPLVVIVGETASGKSALAMDIARRFDGEIICADAMTVYKGFDIGTAKPSTAEQQEIPHHLLDVADAARGFNVAEFKRRAEQKITEVQGRGKLPIMVGGSGLYIDSILFNYQLESLPDSGERDVLNTMSTAELFRLARSRGVPTETIDASNPRRLIRLIETGGMQKKRSAIRNNTCVIGLEVSRRVLEAKVSSRVNAMFDRGLQAEVKALSECYGWDVAAMRSVGYREWRNFLADQEDLATLRDAITRDTLRLAKKQRTWFKRNNSIQWVSDPSEAVAIVTTYLNK